MNKKRLIFSSILFAGLSCFYACSDNTNTINTSEQLLDNENNSSSSISNGNDLDNESQSSSSFFFPDWSSSSFTNNSSSSFGSSSSLNNFSSSSKQPKAKLLSATGGFYSGSVTVMPQNLPSGTDLHCTTNGSMPNESTPTFNGTIIGSNTALRCVLFAGNTPKDTIGETYFINQSAKMPVVAISVDPIFFLKNYVTRSGCEGRDPYKFCDSGLMADVEYPVHVEYFAEGSSSQSKAWEINAGISLMGNWSRTYAKKSVSIAMRSEYEDGRLKYSLFRTRPEANKFKAFNLRNNGNRFVSDYIEDPMATSLLEGSGVDYQRSRQVVVFYNGAYYGIHDMREKLNRHFVETNYGIDSKSVDMVKHVDETITASGDDGNADGYIQMMQFIYANNFTGSNNANYQNVKKMMDVGNYADYMAAMIYYRNGDWPNNNVRAWRSAEQPWKFIAFDVDHGFGWEWCVGGFNYYLSADGESMFKWIRQGGKSPDIFSSSTLPCYKNASAKCFHTIYIKLSQNDDFKRMFINRAAVMYNNFLNSQKVATAVSSMTSSIDPSEISRDQAKFPREYGYIFDASGSSFTSWASARDKAIWGEFQEEFGLSETISVSFKSSGNGIVLMEGKKLPGSTTSTNYTGKFFAGNGIELTAVPTGGAIFSSWSDGSTENPHIVSPTRSGETYTAYFK